jgi:membrane protein DedA with SNARE-associated domain
MRIFATIWTIVLVWLGYLLVTATTNDHWSGVALIVWVFLIGFGSLVLWTLKVAR